MKTYAKSEELEVKELIKPRPTELGIREVETFCENKEGNCGVDVSPEEDTDIILD